MPDKKDFIIKDKRIFAEKDQDQETKEESAKPPKEEVTASKSEETAAPKEDTTENQFCHLYFFVEFISTGTTRTHRGPCNREKDQEPASCKTDHRYFRNAGRKNPREFDKG